MTTLRALSVARPWAGLIVHGGKTVENRTWSTTYRGLLVIHASRRWDSWAAELARDSGLHTTSDGHPTGYLGSAELVDVHPADDCNPTCSPWANGDRWHWVLTSTTAFADPIPGNGRLGLYTPPAEVIRRVRGSESA